MNVRQTIGSGAQALWQAGWKAWAWYAFSGYTVIQYAVWLFHTKSFAAAAANGGCVVLGVAMALNSPRALGLTLPQTYQLARARQLWHSRAAFVLAQAGLGLLLLSLVYWLSFG